MSANKTTMDLSSRMSKLSAMLDENSSFLQGSLVLLDYPLHENVGDLLIWKGEQVFLKRNNKKILGQYSLHNIGTRALNQIDQCKTVCLHGGGNFGDLWYNHQKFREEIISAYPRKRIVIFPQSVHFQDESKLDQACNILKTHKDLYIMLRDKNSYGILEKKNLPNLILCPDMAHALWQTLPIHHAKTDSPLYLMRNDKEIGDLPNFIKSTQIHEHDWAELLKGPMHRIFCLGQKLTFKDKDFNNRLHAFKTWDIISHLLIRRAINMFGQHKTIVTNRLHGMILAALMERNVIAYDNSYGKISSYINCWLQNISAIQIRDPTK